MRLDVLTQYRKIDFSAATLPALSEGQKAILTGNDPTGALRDATLGKEAPLFIGGEALIGARIIEGPFLYTESDVNLCDMIVDLGVMASPAASRTIPYFNINGTKSWEGSFIGPAFAGMEANFLYGSETQTPFASSIARYGSRAVPYRSRACIEVKKIPLSVFNNVVPFISGFLHESDSITRNAALAALARVCRFDTSEFEFDVVGSDPFWVAIQPATFMQYLQHLRSIFRNWNILTAGEKLRVFENSAADGITFNLTRANTAMDSIRITRASADTVEQRLGLGFVDTERDNDFNTVVAENGRFPLPATVRQDASTVELPIGMTSSSATFYVNRAQLIADFARKGFAATGMNALRNAEPGDIALFQDDANISYLGRLRSLVRPGVAAQGPDLLFEQIDFSLLSNIAPHITSNGAGATASITIAENTTAVTTVTASDVNHDLINFSISGGDDADLFTINASTGVLAFIDPPNYEAPEDADTDNVYEVIVQATDGELSDTQAISVTVTDFFEGGTGSGTPNTDPFIIF